MRSFLTPVKRRGKTGTSVVRRWTGATVTSTQAILLVLMHWPIEVLGAFATMFPTALLPKLLRAGAATLVKLGRRTTRTAKSRISTRTAEILRLLPTTQALAPATPHPALSTATAMHLPALIATLWRPETFTTTRCAKSTALGERLRTTSFGARPDAALFIASRPWGLAKVILTARMFLTPIAFVLRVVHRASIALHLRLATLLAIHGRTAEALAAMFRPLIRSAVASVGGRIHGAGTAALRRIHRSTLPIPLGLCVTLRLSAITRTSPIRAALRLTQFVRSGTIPFPLFSKSRQITWCRRRRSIHFGRCGRQWSYGGRLICRLGILGLQ